MKKTCVSGVSIIASAQNQLSDDELSSIIGGKRVKPIKTGGCGCCLCTPSVSASGAGSYTATASGKG